MRDLTFAVGLAIACFSSNLVFSQITSDPVCVGDRTFIAVHTFTGYDWNQANTYAQINYDGTLACPHSLDEFNTLVDLFTDFCTSFGSSEAWIGGYEEVGWNWLDGHPWDTWTYDAWAPYEPNGMPGNSVAYISDASFLMHDQSPWNTLDCFIIQIASGCMDASACNYNPGAFCDDGSCQYMDACGICGGSGTNPGCVDSTACNYNSLADCDDGSCILPDGCTDSAACNFNSTATCDDGSCVFPDGCTDTSACNFDSMALCDDGSCSYPACTHVSACNYDPMALCDNGSCEFTSCRGCTGQLACNYNTSASIDDGSCEYASCSGCTYPGAPEYDSTATIDDGSCSDSSPTCPADFDGNSTINTADLLEFLIYFGTDCE